MTTRAAAQRISEQENANKERYVRLLSLRTAYPRFLEHHVHQLLDDRRVCKFRTDGSLTDGGTEWFLTDGSRLLAQLRLARDLLGCAWP